MGQEAAWVDRLERRFGGFSIPGLAGFLAGMCAAVGVMSYVRPEFIYQLHLDPGLIRQGQVWRAVTFLFIPPETQPLWLLFWVLLFYAAMRSLESAWGDFKLTVFWAAGALATTAASLATGWPLSNVPLTFSVYMAFARLNPEYTILLFFVLPVKLRWLGRLGWALAAWGLLTGGTGTRVALGAGFFNYLLFFGPGHLDDARWAVRRWRNRGRFGP